MNKKGAMMTFNLHHHRLELVQSMGLRKEDINADYYNCGVGWDEKTLRSQKAEVNGLGGRRAGRRRRFRLDSSLPHMPTSSTKSSSKPVRVDTPSVNACHTVSSHICL